MVIFLTLSSCSIHGTYYLRNFLEQPATITLLLNDDITSDGWDNVSFSYVNEVKKIRFGMFRRFEEKIKVHIVDPASVEFTIPPHSTVYLGLGKNSHFYEGFQQVRIKYGDLEKSINMKDHDQLNIRMRGFAKFTGHIDIVN